MTMSPKDMLWYEDRRRKAHANSVMACPYPEEGDFVSDEVLEEARRRDHADMPS